MSVPQPAPEAGRSIGRTLLLAHLSGVISLCGLQGVVPALPAIRHALGLNESQAALLMSAYLLPSVLLAIPAGLLADKLGRRTLFTGSMLLFGVAGAASALASSLGQLIVLRIIQGSAFAAILPLSLTILGDAVSGSRQMRQQGLRAFLIAGGDMLWPLVGGALTLVYWAAPLAVAVVAVPVSVLGWRWLGDDQPASGQARPRPGSLRLLRAVLTRRGLSVQAAGFLRFLFKYALFTILPLLMAQRGSSTIFISSALALAAIAAMVAAAVSPLALRIARASSLLAIGLTAFAGTFAAMVISGGPRTVVAAMILFGLAEGTYSVISNGILLHSVDATERATVVGTAGAIKNLAKFAAPTAISVLVLWVSLEVAFVVAALLAFAMVPFALSLRVLDEPLRAGVDRTGVPG